MQSERENWGDKEEGSESGGKALLKVLLLCLLWVSQTLYRTSGMEKCLRAVHFTFSALLLIVAVVKRLSLMLLLLCSGLAKLQLNLPCKLI